MYDELGVSSRICSGVQYWSRKCRPLHLHVGCPDSGQWMRSPARGVSRFWTADPRVHKTKHRKESGRMTSLSTPSAVDRSTLGVGTRPLAELVATTNSIRVYVGPSRVVCAHV